ncbi:hypothetical protein GEMRC1_006019 [Eukaryota sp. GEM-RC1]
MSNQPDVKTPCHPISSFSTSASKHVFFQQSLLTLINVHLLKFLSMSSYNKFSSFELTDLVSVLPKFFEKVGYVSHHFLESTSQAVRIFLESNPCDLKPSRLTRLTSISSHFNARITSVFLDTYRSFNFEEIRSWTSVIHGLHLELSSTTLFDNLHHTCFPCLKNLLLYAFSDSNFDLLCEFLKHHITVEDLTIDLGVLSLNKAVDFAEALSFNKVLKKVCFTSDPVEYHLILQMSEATKVLFVAIANSTVVDVELSHYFLSNLNSDEVIPLLSSDNLQILGLPEFHVDSSFCDALKFNSCLREISFLNTDLLTGGVSEVLQVNSFLQKLELYDCSLLFTELFKTLDFNFSLKELVISDPKKPLTNQESQLLVTMLQSNTGLRALNFDGLISSPVQFKNLLKGLELNSTLRLVSCSFRSMNLSCLIAVFESQTVNKFKLSPMLKFSVGFGGHSIDTSRGLIRFQNRLTNSDLVALLKALRKKIPIERVESFGVRNIGIKSLFTLYKIYFLKKSVIQFNLSPMFLDFLEKSYFTFDWQSNVSECDYFRQQSVSVDICGQSIRYCHFNTKRVSQLIDFLSKNSLKLVVLNGCYFDDKAHAVLMKYLKKTKSPEILLMDCVTMDDDGCSVSID